MKLLDVLASGVRGAENGSVDILARGTSTRAQVFTDYDGAGAQTPLQALTLDANGGAIWYVNQAVTCRAYSSTGAVVRQFTAFEAATDVEVRSQSFTGQDYTTGASAAGNPTLLSTVLDGWKPSAGATNFNVLVGATIRTIAAAITAASGMFFNVKDPAYGALGDGTTDDRAAVQAAITAANVVGGWVFFPPSATPYLIGSPGLTVNGCAGFMGSHGAVLNSTTNGMTQITVTAGSNGKFEIIGLSFTGSGNTSAWLALNAGDLLLLDVVGTFTYTTMASPGGVLQTAGSGDATTMLGCNLTFPASATAPLNCKTVCWLYCEFNGTGLAAVANSLTRMTDGIIAACDYAVVNALQSYVEQATAAQALTVVGCDFANPSTAGVVSTCFVLPVAAQNFFEFGNSFGANVTPIALATTVADASSQDMQLLSFERKTQFTTDDSANLNVSAAHGSWTVVRTTATAQQIILPVLQPFYRGQRATLTIINNSAGAPVETLTTIKGLASVTPGAGTRQVITMVGVFVATTRFWVLVSSTNF